MVVDVVVGGGVFPTVRFWAEGGGWLEPMVVVCWWVFGGQAGLLRLIPRPEIALYCTPLWVSYHKS